MFLNIVMGLNKMKIPRKYCEKWDAYFDGVTCEWLETGCGDPDSNCPFRCNDRPATHSPDCGCKDEEAID